MTEYIRMLVSTPRGRKILKGVGLQEHYRLSCSEARVAYRMKVAGIFNLRNQNRDFTTSFKLTEVGVDVFKEVFPNEVLSQS